MRNQPLGGNSMPRFAGPGTIVLGLGDMTEMHQPNEFITCADIAEGLQFLTALRNYMTQAQPAAGVMG